MTQLTVQDLQDIAVKCVSGFFNDNVPLSSGLCKEASDRGLNSDQLKRAIEATNTLAHLKAMQMSADKTGEFEVADYGTILKMASLPEGFKPPATDSAQPVSTHPETGLDKQAETCVPEQTSEEIINAFNRANFIKLASNAKRRLDNAMGDSVWVKEALLKQANSVKSDPYSLEAMSVIEDNDEVFSKMAKLVWGADEPKNRLDFAKDVKIPKESLEKAANFRGTFLQATELVKEIQTLKSVTEIDKDHRTEFEKQAFLGLGKSLASAATKAWGPKMTRSAPAAIGETIGKAVSAPFKAVGKTLSKGVVSGVSAGADTARAAGQNAFRKTEIGTKLGVPATTVKPATTKTRKRLVAGMAVAGAAGDATLYTPSKDRVTGASGDVWDQING